MWGKKPSNENWDYENWEMTCNFRSKGQGCYVQWLRGLIENFMSE